MSVPMTVSINLTDDLVANVDCNYTPIVPATHWQPAEGGEVEITSIIVKAPYDPVWIDMTELLTDLVYAGWLEKLQEQCEEDYRSGAYKEDPPEKDPFE